MDTRKYTPQLLELYRESNLQCEMSFWRFIDLVLYLNDIKTFEKLTDSPRMLSFKHDLKEHSTALSILISQIKL